MSDPYAADPGGSEGEPAYPHDSDEVTVEDDYSPVRSYSQPGGRRRAKRRGIRSCLVFIVIFAVVMVGLYVGLTKGIRAVQDQFSEPEDYPGPGSGQVAVDIETGSTIAAMGRTLKDAGVVASVDAFIAAANANPDSGKIQAGTYELMSEMRASDAVAILVDPASVNAGNVSVPVPEGLRVVDIIAILSEKTGIGQNKFKQALKDPAALGLPDYADGNAEGYLFPATYSFAPDASPASMLKAMVDRWRQSAESSDLEAKAEALGYTPQEIMTIASMVQAEGRGDDMPKIARVIYNRLEIDPNPAAGFLQIDATVNYALGRSLVAVPTTEDTEVDSPYNTYANKGLPPGPIEAPGDDAIAAALNPVAGDWFFYVTVNLATGETKFTDDYDTFLTYKNELRDYCATESDRC